VLTERQTEPGLVPFYDIQPGNGVGLFLQPRRCCTLALFWMISGWQSRCKVIAQ